VDAESGNLMLRKLRHEARSVAPVRYKIDAGFGFAQDGEPNVKEETMIEEMRRRLLVVRLGAPFPDSLLQTLESKFSVTVRASVPPAFAETMRDGIGALLLCVQRDTLEDALQEVRNLRAADIRTPVLLLTPFGLRASDRTRALRAGADEFLSAKLAEPEFLERLRGIVRRGRSKAIATRDQGIPTVLQPMDDQGHYQLFDEGAFAATVQAVITGVRDPFFSVLRISSPGGDQQALAGLIIRILRVDSGDFAGLFGDGVISYLEGARPADLAGLLARIDAQWAELQGPPLLSEAFGYPTDVERLNALLGLAVG
jgi:CheY-like chemotaxis protein